jgi:hypothetical protein
MPPLNPTPTNIADVATPAKKMRAVETIVASHVRNNAKASTWFHESVRHTQFFPEPPVD